MRQSAFVPAWCWIVVLAGCPVAADAAPPAGAHHALRPDVPALVGLILILPAIMLRCAMADEARRRFGDRTGPVRRMSGAVALSAGLVLLVAAFVPFRGSSILAVGVFFSVMFGMSARASERRPVSDQPRRAGSRIEAARRLAFVVPSTLVAALFGLGIEGGLRRGTRFGIADWVWLGGEFAALLFVYAIALGLLAARPRRRVCRAPRRRLAWACFVGTIVLLLLTMVLPAAGRDAAVPQIVMLLLAAVLFCLAVRWQPLPTVCRSAQGIPDWAVDRSRGFTPDGSVGIRRGRRLG